MFLTAEDVEREHDAALASLTQAQRRALNRLATARSQTNFNGRFPKENLRAMFQKEAEQRNGDAWTAGDQQPGGVEGWGGSTPKALAA